MPDEEGLESPSGGQSPILFLAPALLSGGLASIGPADREAATQEFSIGAGSGQAQGFPPGALGDGVSAEAEMELADHRVPTGITGGNAFRRNGGQAIEAGLRALQVSFGDRAVEGVERRRRDAIERLV